MHIFILVGCDVNGQKVEQHDAEYHHINQSHLFLKSIKDLNFTVGDNFNKNNFKTNFEEVYAFINKDKTQKIWVDLCCGSFGEIQRIYIFKSNYEYNFNSEDDHIGRMISNSNFIYNNIDINKFSTNTNIFLNMNLKDFPKGDKKIKKLGNGFQRYEFHHNTIDGRVYFEYYYFKNDILVLIAFGYENP